MLVQLFLTALACAGVTGVTTPCVCTHHVLTRIHDKPEGSSPVVGFMYDHDCKLQRIEPAFAHSGYYAVQHYHQVGYVKLDSEVVAKNCTNFSLHPDDKLTTTAPPVTTTSTTTRDGIATKPPYSAMCNKLAVFSDIARDVNVGLFSSDKCPDNLHHDADVAVSAFCGAPDSSLWLRGSHVVTNCDRLARYIPVASFDHSATYKQTAGILIACGKNSLHIATQNCTTGIHIVEISTKNHPGPGDFFVVEW